jgi:predicted metalloprotease with PDZ domain
MKLLKIGLLAAFVPTLALADPPPPTEDDNPPATAPDQAPNPYDSSSKDQAKPSDNAPFGLTVKVLTAEQRQSFGGPKDSGLLVTAVQAGSPAARAGVQAGDVITKIDDAAIANSSDLDRAWMQDKSKSKASIEVVRDHKTMNLTATPSQGSEDKMQPKSTTDEPSNNE